jgi:hypothetical protein
MRRSTIYPVVTAGSTRTAAARVAASRSESPPSWWPGIQAPNPCPTRATTAPGLVLNRAATPSTVTVLVIPDAPAINLFPLPMKTFRHLGGKAQHLAPAALLVDSATGTRCSCESTGHLAFADLGVSPIRFTSYDIYMVSEEQIQSWVAEAEAGYDVQELKRRGRGRPGRGAEPMQVVAVRLTAEEVAALDEVAEREHLSRSEAIRRALADFAA